MFHPSFYTLSPIIGVCLIIWFSHKDELITKILSTKLFVGIGLISYSLYLWHYLIFSLLRNSYLVLEPNNIAALPLTLTFMVILFSIILSLITYKYIEVPYRKNKIINTASLFKFISLFLTKTFGFFNFTIMFNLLGLRYIFVLLNSNFTF